MSNTTRRPGSALFTLEMLWPSLQRSLVMLNPLRMARNPVMFVTEIGAALTTLFTIDAYVRGDPAASYFSALTILLWMTVIFANFAEAVAEARGRAQAASLRAARKDVTAHKVAEIAGRVVDELPASMLKVGDMVIVRPGEVIPADGEAIEGIAMVDESAITGESAPVIRESGGDRSAVTGGTRVVSDHLFIRVTARPGESFLDRMIAMVEGAARKKTPNEIALTIVLAGFTFVFLLVCATLYPIAQFFNVTIDVPTLVALLVCLIPTTIGALLAAIGIAGIARLSQANVMAMSGRAVEAAGDVDVLLLDKTGTITLGNRQADAFLPAPGINGEALARAAQLASLADETAEGRSIVVLAKKKHNLRGRSLEELKAEFVPFTARTRMSGINLDGRQIRKGAADNLAAFVDQHGGSVPSAVTQDVERVAREGGTPLVVAENGRVLGVVYLKDIVKGGIKERFIELRRMGIRTVMITGDNVLTATAIAAEAGVDDFLAEATPEAKLALIRKYQADGHMVAMTGDGTNDAPALAQADVAVAMNTGTQAAKEAGNMVDLDSNPTKLIDIVGAGKQLLMTRGALTTFSIANDVAKYFAIIPALFIAAMPQLEAINIMQLSTPRSAILSAVIFNAIIIPLLIPLAIKGVKYRPLGADAILARNLLIYGVGGLIAPFIGIKLLDALLTLAGWAQATANGACQLLNCSDLTIRKQRPLPMFHDLITSMRSILATLVVCMVLYPAALLGFAMLTAPQQRMGSLIVDENGAPIGSSLVAQGFTQPGYFWPRPSAVDYNAAGAGGSNLSPLNPLVRERAKGIMAQLSLSSHTETPADLVTTSGGGLDPRITLAGALVQVPRIAEARNASEESLIRIVQRIAKAHPAGTPGEASLVNVLLLNLEVNREFPSTQPPVALPAVSS